MHVATLQVLLATAPARVIAIAGVVSVLTQLIKRYVPDITGPTAMLVNLAFSVATIFASMDPANFWTLATMQQVVAVFAAAAGIHSTAKSFRATQPGVPGSVKIASMVFAMLMSSAVIGGCAVQSAKATVPLPAGAIDQTDATANESLQAAHAFARSVTLDYFSGKLTLTANQKVAVGRLNEALNVADAAEQAYHSGGGGNGSILSASIAAAQNALMAAQAALIPSAAN